MKIVITGSGGYIGRKLIARLIQEQTEIISVTRKMLYSDPSVLAERISGCEVIVNLAGAPVLQRWTSKNKETIYNSRVVTTQNLANAVIGMPANSRPKVFISASAIGIYRNNEPHDETSTRFNEEFLGKVVTDWEQASEIIELPTRRVIFRLGVVLGNGSQTLKTMLPIFRLGLGGIIGNGKQAFPFVHIDDVVSAILWAIQNEKVNGTYNLIAPENITNKEFTAALAQQLKRPALFRVPAFALKLLYGKAAEMLIKSPLVVTKRLNEDGFGFVYPTIKSALK